MNQQLADQLASAVIILKVWKLDAKGDYTVIVNGVPFPRYRYDVACALYSVARKNGASVALVNSDKLIRRTYNSKS